MYRTFFPTMKHEATCQLIWYPLLLTGNAAYTEFAPPKSYIDVRDFESPSHLASHLKYLMDHPKEYDSYLEWSKRYRVLNNSLVSTMAVN